MAETLEHRDTGATLELPDGWAVLRPPYPNGWGRRGDEAIAFRGEALAHARRVLWIAREPVDGDLATHAADAMRDCYDDGVADPFTATVDGRRAIGYEWGDGPLKLITWFVPVDGGACRIDFGWHDDDSPHAEARALLGRLHFAHAKRA